MSDLPGPGDETTWPPYYGHPNDPRNDNQDEKDEDREIDYEEEEVNGES
jgi:hypothetical protein